MTIFVSNRRSFRRAGTRSSALCQLSLVMAFWAFCPVTEAASKAGEASEQKEALRSLQLEMKASNDLNGARLDMQDKRIADLGLSIASQSNHLSAVATYVGWTSAAITLVVSLAGLLTYIGVKRRAVDEAQEASERWFAEQGEALKLQLEEVKQQMRVEREAIRLQGESASAEIKRFEANVEAEALKANQAIASRVLFAAGSVHQALTRSESKAVETMESVNESLKLKPEASFTTDDFLYRGLALVAQEQFESALQSFESGLSLTATGRSVLPERVANLLFSRATTLSKLGRRSEALEAYAELDRRFSSEQSSEVRQFLARGLVNTGALLGASQDLEGGLRALDVLIDRYAIDRNPELREHVATALLNKSTLLGNLDRTEEALKIHEELARSIGTETEGPLKGLASRAFNGIGFDRLILAKKGWADEAGRNEQFRAAVEALERARDLCEARILPMILGNLGYVAFLQGNRDQAYLMSRECLRLGGERAKRAQLMDAKRYPVEPLDTEYVASLGRIWSELGH